MPTFSISSRRDLGWPVRASALRERASSVGVGALFLVAKVDEAREVREEIRVSLLERVGLMEVFMKEVTDELGGRC